MFVRSIGLMLCISALVLGSTYYIDYSGGTDANPGTSKTAPWKRCPGMSGFAATYTHAPGDVFIFKGGVIWPAAALPFTIAHSGASGNIDTYTTDHSWYTGSAWKQPTFDGGLFGRTLLYASEKSYFKIDDLRLINAGLTTANGVVAFAFTNCSNIEVSNNTLAPQSWGCLYVSTERTGDFSNFSIHHNDISACAFGMRFVPGAAASYMHNVEVYNNTLHDFHSQLSGDVHGDGIQCYNTPDVAASYDRYVDGFKIFNNRFTGDFTQVAGSSGAMTALIYLSGATKGVQIYNNLFAPITSGTQSPNFFESFISLRDNPNRGGYHKIYNNTFETQVAGGQAAAILEDDTRYPSPGLDIKNNIFSNFNWPFDLRSTNHTIDYNDQYFVRDIGKWAGNFVGSFANWQALGLDVHGISVNPGFVSSTDFHLAQSSPCIGKGTNLSSVITRDLDGNARPSTAGFSLGAYEFGAAPPPPPSDPLAPSTISLWWPGNGATGVVLDPSLTWSAEPGALAYAVQVSTVSSFASTVVNQTGIASTTLEATLTNGTTYYWRVNATKATGTTTWSTIGRFVTVAGLPPPTLTLWWPANGATGIVTEPSLTWSPVAEALSYALQVSTDPGFVSVVVHKTGIGTTSFDATGLSYATTYYWRVNVTSASGVSGWSLGSGFTTAAPPSNAYLQDPGTNGIVSIDAEHYTATVAQSGHSWTEVSKTGYAGEGAMQVLPNNGASINTGFAVTSPRMDYLVNFKKTGKHYIWVRGIGLSGNDDSYHAGIDGREIATCDRISSFTTQWKWSRTDMEGRAAYFTVAAVGEHTVNIWMREDGLIIDKIVITTNPNYVPTGAGPVESVSNGLKKEVVPVPATGIRPAQHALDISSCRSGAVQISLSTPGPYRLTIHALNGQMVGAFAGRAEAAGPTSVSLGRRIPAGFCLMQLSVNGSGLTRKIYVTN